MEKTETMGDVDYFNGFRTAVKLINYQLQYLRSGIEEYSPKKYKEFKNMVASWEKNVFKDMNSHLTSMENTMYNLYGPKFKLDRSDDCYFIDEKV